MAEALVAGKRHALSKGITLVESLRAEDQRRASELVVETLRRGAAAGRKPAFRVGFCGPPGVGKSSIIEELGRQLVEDGHRVAVLVRRAPTRRRRRRHLVPPHTR
jgi:LAO/AO transport system kinase